MKRLQVVLDEMRIWEREVFEKEYADANWFKGKQSKHVHEMEMARRRTGLGLFLLLLASHWTVLTIDFCISVNTSTARNI